MIAYIKGTLALVQEEAIVVDVGGIGYEIICSDPFAFQTAINEEVFVYTYHHTREDVESLYGFKHEDEKYLFTQLISVSGIGPKSANTILGTVHVPDFISAVEREDEKYLTQFPGVGKKTARQIILDLKGKMTNVLTVEQSEKVEQGTPNDEQFKEAEAALIALGYSEREINSIYGQLMQEDATETDEIIRKALSLLMKS